MRHPLPISSSQSQEATAGGSRLVNSYAEAAPQPGGKSPVVTRSAPGVRTFADVGIGPGRGMHVAGGTVYAVSGNLLYTVAEDQTVGIVGELIGTGRVSFADNGAGQVMMIAGGKGWVLENGTLTQIIDPDFPSPSVVDHLDGYMLVAEANSGKFFASSLLDATSTMRSTSRRPRPRRTTSFRSASITDRSCCSARRRRNSGTTRAGRASRSSVLQAV